MMLSFEDYKIPEAPSSLYYIPNFITPEEEKCLIEKIYSAPKPKWTQLLNRRLQNWGGIPHPNGMIAEEIPQWLKQYVDKVNQLNIFDDGKKSANHVLVNEYLPGQGIMGHTDGPLFLPTISTISCGSHTILEFQPMESNTGRSVGVLLERCSLVIVKDSLYSNYLHLINEKFEDTLDSNIVNLGAASHNIDKSLSRNTRLSITIRHVPKTSKLKIKLSR